MQSGAAVCDQGARQTVRASRARQHRLAGTDLVAHVDETGGIVDQLVAQYGTDRDTAVQRFLQERQMPMGIGQPEDVAHAAVFLASPLARFITGAALDIGGTIRGLI